MASVTLLLPRGLMGLAEFLRSRRTASAEPAAALDAKPQEASS